MPSLKLVATTFHCTTMDTLSTPFTFKEITMTTPSVVFHVPNDYPPILMEMFSADILAQLPDGTIAEIRHFIDQVDDIKAGLKAASEVVHDYSDWN
jgi:hypothetical protein